MNYLNFFEKWYVITINDSNDYRLKNMFTEMKINNYEIIRYKPSNKIINVNKNESILKLFTHNSYDDTVKNIFDNHISTIKKGKSENKKNFVILEDDAFINSYNKKQIQNIYNFINKNSWDIFLLGHCPFPPISIISSKNIVKPYYPLLAHAYVMNCNSVDKFLDICYKNNNMHIDKIFSISNLNIYATFPSIILQLKPPAIYKEIINRLGLDINFNNLCYKIEIFSTMIPILIIMCITIIISKYICKRIYRKKNISIDK